MSKKAGLGIVGALAVGIGLYFVLKKSNFNFNSIIPNSISRTPQNTEPKAAIITNPVIDNADLAPTITPEITRVLQSVGITEGSQITNIIHGGTPCGYRGTNGKCYDSYEDALRNGAA